MSKRAIQVFLFLFISVFVFNQFSDLMLQHTKDGSSFCYELNEVKELCELSTRFKPVDLSGFQYAFLNFGRWIRIDPDVSVAQVQVVQRSFFPHAAHVRIYLDKCTFLI